MMAARSAPAKDGSWKGKATVNPRERPKVDQSRGKVTAHPKALKWWAPKSRGKAKVLLSATHWEFAKGKEWGPS